MNSSRNIILALAFFICMPSFVFAQKSKDKDKKDVVYQITDTIEVPHTSPKNQAQSGTCWCFAGTGFAEAEILRKYDKELDLSEMFFVRWAYTQKFSRFVRMHGTVGISCGGEVIDVLNAINENGMITEEAYNGLVLGDDRHCHWEMDNTINEYAKVVTKKGNGRILDVWHKGIASILDIYLGEVPSTFNFDGVTYYPESFAKKYALNIEDYVQLGAFTHRALYKPFIMEIPDNWTNTFTYNMSLDELMAALDTALTNGYTVGWAQDVSDKGFTRNEGVGVVLEDDIEKIRESNPKLYKKKTDAEIKDMLYKFEVVMPEKEVTEEMHQTAYDNWQTTDDHSMLIVGIGYDQNGTKYYKVKNSWGETGAYKGYWYCSEPYVRLHTVFFTVNKEAISSEMNEKLGF